MNASTTLTKRFHVLELEFGSYVITTRNGKQLSDMIAIRVGEFTEIY